MKYISKNLTAVTTGIATISPVASWAQQNPDPNAFGYPYGAPMMGWGGGWGGMIFGPFFMIIVLALVIALAVLLVRWIGDPRTGAGHSGTAPLSRTPVDILRERLAKGEIDKEEFQERLRALGE